MDNVGDSLRRLSTHGNDGNVTSVGWQVTLCDPICDMWVPVAVWQVRLRTATSVILAYLLGPYRKYNSMDTNRANVLVGEDVAGM